MSKREQTATVEDLYCDETPCIDQALGPCVFCPKDLCRDHGDVDLRRDSIVVLICNAHRGAQISELVDDPERIQRRWDEYNTARQAITESNRAKSES